VIVQEMMSSEDSESDESPEARTRQKSAKLRNSFEERLRSRGKQCNQDVKILKVKSVTEP
jgi:hypothetical protein